MEEAAAPAQGAGTAAFSLRAASNEGSCSMVERGAWYAGPSLLPPGSTSQTIASQTQTKRNFRDCKLVTAPSAPR